MKIQMKPWGIAAITAIVLLIIASVLFYYFKVLHFTGEKIAKSNNKETETTSFSLSDLERKPLPKNITQYSKKYHLLENVYNSDKTVFIYGYEKNQKDEPLDESFHKKMTKALEKESLNNYNIIALQNVEKEIIAAFKKNGIGIDEDEECTDKTKEEQELEVIIDTTFHCYANACIIDFKKNQYIMLPKDVNCLIKALKEYK